mmetsp:Transcript_80175/g.210576  ORF Transcript_80175/g.210576 Transcript_80175/m.210576 type:complete len:139 (+) Transcript_80175:99-515(+)
MAAAPRRQQGPLLSPIQEHGRSRSVGRDLPKVDQTGGAQARSAKPEKAQKASIDKASIVAFLQEQGSLGGLRHPKWSDCQKPVRRSRSTPAAQVHVIWPPATGFQSEPFGGGRPMNGMLAEGGLRSLRPSPAGAYSYA